MASNDSSSTAAKGAVCPLCGGDNACAMAASSTAGAPTPACWCMNTRIDSEVLARIPPEQRGRVCVCAQCAGRTRVQAA